MYVVPSEKLADSGQSIAGRLWDLLWMFRLNAMRTNKSLLYFSCLFLDVNEKLDEMKLKALCGPGDNAEPVITIMLPGED